jgi:hypothetical protein
MRPLIYVATFIAALVSVAMGVSLVDTTPVRIAARPAAEPIRHEAAPVQPAVPSPAAPAPSAAAPRPAQQAPNVAQQPAPQIYQPEQTTAQSPEPPPSCNVAACTAAYRSFTASDCTYQPLEGPRRLCSK